MPKLHDPAVCESIKSRLNAVTADSARKWGSMTADQMMWHLGRGLEQCMGRLDARDEKPAVAMPKPLLRFFVFNMPWPKNAPSMRVLLANGRYDLEEERARCLRLIDEFTSRPLEKAWPVHPTLGDLSGEQYSRLQAKHLNHHLRQFGV